MSVEIAAIRGGLATNLKTISETRQVSAYRLDAATPPALMVVGFDVVERVGMGSFQLGFLVQGLAGAPTDKGAQIRLDKWISPTGSLSVWRAIESDKTLGGVVDNAVVLRCDGAQFIETKHGEFLGSTWHVQVEI